MRIAIIGAGAMGSLFGGELAGAGHDVLLYDLNQEHVEAVARQGLAIEEAASGQVHVVHPKATAELRDLDEREVLIVFVKSTATAAVAGQIQERVGKNAIVATLQNGLGNEEVLRRVFGPDRTAAGVTSQGATFLGPGRIRHAGRGPTHLGMSDRRNEKLKSFVEALNAAGFETHIEENVERLVWSKLIINVGINALTGLTGLTNGRLLDFPEIRELMGELVAEAVAVARSRGIGLTYEKPLEMVMEVARKTGANRSSMLQDFDRRRETEIDVINGAIVREAEKLGMQAPVNRSLTRLVKALDRIHGESRAAS